jgi:protoporphyrinogen oxidase
MIDSREPELGQKKVLIIGGGPAGLTAAYELGRHQIPSIVLEQHALVGGHARTESYKGFLFDVGGHRFFTKVETINRFWREVLGEAFMTVPRLSRIYYNGKFFHYPLKLWNVLQGLGLTNSALILLSYIQAHFFPYRQEENLEQWVINRFGRRLYRTFFKTYTEKVWGQPCTEIRADWAAQRIKGLSFTSALRNALSNANGNRIKTLIEQFQYPVLGPGMMWQEVGRIAEANGSEIRLNSEVIQIRRTGHHVDSVTVRCGSHEEVVSGTDFISSMPVNLVIARMAPPPPERVLMAAHQLRHRDFLMVALIVNQKDLFPDNWIYVHSPKVKVARIQNFKNWSARMTPDPNKTSLGLEYFCSVGDELWEMPDSDLIERAKRELEAIGLARQSDVEDGTVIRELRAYPVYDPGYQVNLEVIKQYLGRFDNFQTVGRNGLHRYNNQDHAMLTAILAVRNILGENHDIWSVNTDDEYQEEISEGQVHPAPSSDVLRRSAHTTK